MPSRGAMDLQPPTTATPEPAVDFPIPSPSLTMSATVNSHAITADSGHSRLSRSSSLKNRPALSPMGPRCRLSSRSTTLFDTSSTTLFDTSSTYDSVSLSPTADTASFYTTTTPKGSPHQSLNGLCPIAETPRPKSASSPPPPAVRIVPKPAVLVPAPQISFEPVPVDFKSLPLEAFLWTLDNSELQHMVSRAIRQSARESFIRLLSLDSLDNAIPAEIQRLNSLKGVTQSRYRFVVQRRTMLLQALNSNSAREEIKVEEDGTSVVSQLTQQLSEACAECDQLLEVLLRVTDQLGQITKLLDVHWAGALAIALRKLNKSYAKRTSELLIARDKVEQLEGELEEGWKEAARYAHEMDQAEAGAGEAGTGAGAASSDEELEEEAVIEKVEKVTIPPMLPASGTLLKSRSNTPSSNTGFLDFSSPSMSTRPTSFLSGTVQTIPTDVSPTPSSSVPPQHEPDRDDAASTRSEKSTRSTRSTKSNNASRVSQLFAARIRSKRMSKNSLRLPSKPRISLQPPVPDLPLEYTLPVVAGPSSFADPTPSAHPSGGSTRVRSRPATSGGLSSASSVFRFRRMSSFDMSSPRLSSRRRAMDDIYVRPYLIEQPSSVQESGKRVLPPRPTRPAPPPVITTAPPNMPKMWLLSDGVSNNAGEIDPDPSPSLPPISPRSKSFRRPQTSPQSSRSSNTNYGTHSKVATRRKTLGPTPAPANTAYDKLKNLSQRYSMPFPLFKSLSTGAPSVRSLPSKKPQAVL